MNIKPLHAKYGALIFLVGGFFLVELVVGTTANSIVLQTDAFHMLGDLLALIIGLSSTRAVTRNSSKTYTYGWLRAEIIGGFINSMFLITISFTLFIENIEKIIRLIVKTENDELDEEINLVLIVASIGLFINIVGVLLFWKEHSHTHYHPVETDDPEVERLEKVHTINHNQAAVLLHVLGDALGSVVAIASTLGIKYIDSKWKYFLDPLGSLIIITVIAFSSTKLLMHCVQILMHKWTSVSKELLNEISQLNGVCDVHEFHVWPLTSRVMIASMHVKLEPFVKTDQDSDELIGKIKSILHRQGIHSSTVQPEWSSQCIEPACQRNCAEQQCCNENGVELP